MNGYVTSVGPDLSRPAPIDRPVGNPPPTRMHVLKLIIGLAGLSEIWIILLICIRAITDGQEFQGGVWSPFQLVANRP